MLCERNLHWKNQSWFIKAPQEKVCVGKNSPDYKGSTLLKAKVHQRNYQQATGIGAVSLVWLSQTTNLSLTYL